MRLGIPMSLVMIVAWPALAAVEPVVDDRWVAAHSCDPDVVVLDLRDNARAFAFGHVPCSVSGPYRASGWQQKRDDIPGMMPAPEEAAKMIGALGISNDSHVVLVAEGGSVLAMTAATRAYWTFKSLGHDSVSILDGGFAAYRANPDNPLSKGESTPAPATFTARPNAEYLATHTEVATALGTDTQLVDSRFSDVYMGINKSSSVRAPGTLPGATNLPISWLTHGDGRLHASALQAEIAAAAGVATDQPQILFCNSGRMASFGWFVAHELLGNANARLYDGSMAEWASDESRPVSQKVRMP